MTKDEIYQFIREAPDQQYLAIKVVLIIGVYGSCRRAEIKDMTLDQMVFCQNPPGVMINLPETKTDKVRQFAVAEGDQPYVNLISIVRKYAALRPPNMETQRFFMGYRKGKCIRQPIGIHSIGGFPKIIATFLKLPNPATYTGHCYRRSGVSLMAESGATLADMRRHCGWVNESMAERYIELSVNNKRKIAGHILGRKAPPTSTITSGSETVASNTTVSDVVLVPPFDDTDEVPAASSPTVNSVRTFTVVQSQSQIVASSLTSSSNGPVVVVRIDSGFGMKPSEISFIN